MHINNNDEMSVKSAPIHRCNEGIPAILNEHVKCGYMDMHVDVLMDVHVLHKDSYSQCTCTYSVHACIDVLVNVLHMDTATGADHINEGMSAIRNVHTWWGSILGQTLNCWAMG